MLAAEEVQGDGVVLDGCGIVLSNVCAGCYGGGVFLMHG